MRFPRPPRAPVALLAALAVLGLALVALAPLDDARARDVAFLSLALTALAARAVWRHHRRRLRESEERYRALAETSQDDIFIVDVDGHLHYVNPRAASRFAGARGELRGRRLDELFPPPMAVRLLDSVRTAASTGQPLYAEREVPFPGGSAWLGSWLVPLRDEPAAGAVMGVSRDITELKRTEHELRETTRVLLESQRVAGLGSYRADFVAGTWESSPILDEIFGIGPEFHRDVPGWLSIIHPAQRNEMAAYLAGEVLGRGRPFDREYRILRRSDGEERWVHGLGETQADGAGRVVTMIGTIQDVTERKRAEAVLRASQERYRSLFDRNLAGVYRTSIDGRILECNDAFARIFGFGSRGDAVGSSAEALYPPPAGHQAFLARLREQGALINHELEGRRRDGSPVWLLANAHLVGGEEASDGSVIEGTLIDITERRQIESQLRHAQKLEAVGRLAGGVAHDFNNILGVILGLGTMLGRQVAAEQRGKVEQIMRAAERAAGLTRQLLAFSRRQVVEPRVLDLNALLTDLDGMLGRVIGEDVEVAIQPGSGLGRVMADPGQMGQVVMNLCVNARDAMPDGGLLRLETANVDLEGGYAAQHEPMPAGRYVMLSVSDTGTGIEKDLLDRIFEPFFTTKGPGKGTGLGLAMVYGIVKQAGGHIGVDSEVGRGTTFRIYLPRFDQAAEPALLREVEPLPTGSETILLVEDEPLLRSITRQFLEEGGYRVLDAAGGAEALEAARRQKGPIDLLITDVVMPGLNGRELAESLKAERPGLRVLYISGYTDDVIADRGVLEPGTHFLGKPFTVAALLRRVREVLGH